MSVAEEKVRGRDGIGDRQTKAYVWMARGSVCDRTVMEGVLFLWHTWGVEWKVRGRRRD